MFSNNTSFELLWAIFIQLSVSGELQGHRHCQVHAVHSLEIRAAPDLGGEFAASAGVGASGCGAADTFEGGLEAEWKREEAIRKAAVRFWVSESGRIGEGGGGEEAFSHTTLLFI